MTFSSLFAAAAPDAPREHGPWCSECGHEYRGKDGVLELVNLYDPVRCPYCGLLSMPAREKPFEEISKSKYETWRCLRRGAFKYIEDLPDAKAPSAEFGIVGHEIAEDYLARRRLPIVDSLKPKSTETRAAISLLAGIMHAPNPDHPGLGVEREFHFEYGGIRWMGYKDFEAPVAAPLFPSNDPLVGDWKFSSDVVKWAPTAEKLSTDVQAVLESYDWVRRGASGVWLRWIYMERGKRVARPVSVYVTAEHIEREMAKLVPEARRILDLTAAKVSANSLPPNLSQCRLYPPAGCPFQEVCDLTPSQRMTAQLGEPTMNNTPTPMAGSALEDLVSMISGGAPPLSPPIAPPPPPAAAPSPPPQIATGVLPPPSAPPVAPPPAAAPAETTVMVQINGSAPIAWPVSRLSELPVGQWTVAPASAPEAPAPAVASSAAPAAAERRPRGRPKKDVVAPPAPPAAAVAAALLASEILQPPAPAPTVAPSPPLLPGMTFGVAPPACTPEPPAATASAFLTAAAEALAASPPFFTLYVNCAPTKHDAHLVIMTASDLIREPARIVCERNENAPHYRAIDYGKGPGLLAAMLEKFILEGDGLGGADAVTVDTRTPEGADIAPTLERLARVVVRGC